MSRQSMKRQQVLVVEDDAPMRNFYRLFFQKRLDDEFNATIVADAEQALGVLHEKPIDIVVLDWRLPGISGTSLTKALRSDAKTRELGILMVTAKSSLGEEIVALESGADDHLAKPFDENVLQARLRSLVRRREINLNHHQTQCFPGLVLDWNAGSLTVDGRPVHLTPKELELLRIFLRRPGMIHAHSYLWQALWGYESDLWDHILIVTISSLRRKLGPEWGAHLQMHTGKGYSFES